jgi:hypothetical protein
MAAGELLYDLLSVSAFALGRAIDEMFKLPLDPERLSVGRAGACLGRIRALQGDVATAFPELVRRDRERRVGIEAAEQRLAACLADAHRLERDGQIAEAIAVYEQFSAAETTPEHTDLVARQIERLKVWPPSDDGPDLPPWNAALAHVGALAASDLDAIDQALLAETTRHFRKVAMVIATVMSSGLREQLPGIPDVFYALRIIRLVKLGQLEAQGDLRRMRYSEVRRPG